MSYITGAKAGQSKKKSVNIRKSPLRDEDRIVVRETTCVGGKKTSPVWGQDVGLESSVVKRTQRKGEEGDSTISQRESASKRRPKARR